MINKTILLFIIICAFPIAGNAQINLVYNGSFEEIRTCPDNRQQIMYANYWHTLDTLWAYDTSSTWSLVPADVPSLFTTCGYYLYASLPLNFNFYSHYPRTGNAMVQIQTYRNNDTSLYGPLFQREHAQGKLKQTLIHGKYYCVTFYISLNQATAYAANNIGAYLDDGTIDTVQWPRQGTVTSTPVMPQVYDTVTYTDTLHWHKIQGSFTAEGNERFITIANFFDNAHTNAIPISIPTLLNTTGGGDLVYGLYLIDDVSVIAIDAVANAGRDTSISTEMSDSAWIGNHDGYVPCRWYNMSGTIIDSNKGGFMVKPGVTTSYIMELDVCGHVTRDTVRVYVSPVSVASPGPSHRGVTCYPNPASNEITIEGANDCELVIYDVVGRQVMKSEDRERRAAGEKAVIDISRLANGVYFVKVTDPVTQESVVVRLLKE